MLALAGFLLIAVGPLAFRYGLVSANVGLGTVALGVLLATGALVAAIVAFVRGWRVTNLPVLVLAAVLLGVPAWTMARVWLGPAPGSDLASSLVLTGDPLETFGRAGRAAQEIGWRVEQVDEAGGRILATDTSRWFRFTDEVDIRVRPEGDRDQVRVDLRVTPRARIGEPWRTLLRLGEGAANTRRVADYVRRLASLR